MKEKRTNRVLENSNIQRGKESQQRWGVLSFQDKENFREWCPQSHSGRTV